MLELLFNNSMKKTLFALTIYLLLMTEFIRSLFDEHASVVVVVQAEPLEALIPTYVD